MTPQHEPEVLRAMRRVRRMGILIWATGLVGSLATYFLLFKLGWAFGGFLLKRGF
jgi:hypothetical protein